MLFLGFSCCFLILIILLLVLLKSSFQFHKLVVKMTTPTTQFAPSGRMCLYEPMHQISMWEETFDGNISPGSGVCLITESDSKIEYTSDKSIEHGEDTRGTRSVSEKMQRRLAQNREAARKSRLRKKAYVQQLETSRLKLAQLELELERGRQQRMVIANASMGLNAGIAAFEMEYSQWIDEQDRKMCDLRSVLQSQSQSPSGGAELRIMVENVLNHYCELFRMKRDAAAIDAFYLVSGAWRSSVERFFLWIGGFKPSELINVVMPQLQPLTDQQNGSVDNLKHSCMQAEDALSQGMEKLQQTLAQSFSFPSSHTLENLECLESFINQADHLREQTLQHMARILTTRQAANGLVAFGDYFQRLRALSSFWSTRCPRAA